MKKTLLIGLLLLSIPLAPSNANAQVGAAPNGGIVLIPAPFISGGGSAAGSILAIAGSCVAGSVSYSYVGDTNTGQYNGGTSGYIFQCNDAVTTSAFHNDGGGVQGLRLAAASQLSWSPTSNTATSSDTKLYRLSAGAFASNNDALGSTSTDGFALRNTTAATGGATVQISPRSKWCGTAWNSSGSASETDCFIAEVLPATVAGTTTSTLKFGSSINGGAYTYPATLTSAGIFTTISSIISGGNFSSGSSPDNGILFGTLGRLATTGSDGQFELGNNSVAAAVGLDVTTNSLLKIRTRAQSAYASVDALAYQMSGLSQLRASADKLVQINDSGNTTGLELNGGTPTLGTCTGGSVTSGSHNTAGEITGNTSGSCAINFGTPNFTNAPFCTINDEGSLTAARVSARSASSITVTGVPSGEAFQWICIGRIGT